MTTPQTQSKAAEIWNSVWKNIFQAEPSELRLDFNSPYFIEINKVLNPKSAILEIGCGTGALSIALALKGYRVTATDCSDSALTIMKANISKVKVKDKIDINTKLLDMLSPEDYPKEKFDAVICHSVFQYFSEIEIFQSIKSFSYVLNNGGYLFLGIRKKNIVIDFLKIFGFLDNYTTTNKNFYTKITMLNAYFKQTGFKLFKNDYYFTMSSVNSPYVKRIDKRPLSQYFNGLLKMIPFFTTFPLMLKLGNTKLVQNLMSLSTAVQ